MKHSPMFSIQILQGQLTTFRSCNLPTASTVKICIKHKFAKNGQKSSEEEEIDSFIIQLQKMTTEIPYNLNLRAIRTIIRFNSTPFTPSSHEGNIFILNLFSINNEKYVSSSVIEIEKSALLFYAQKQKLSLPKLKKQNE